MLPLENAVDHLKRAAAAADAMLGREENLPPATQARINASLAPDRPAAARPAGLPGRPWFKNLVYAPGTLTGYGAKTLPGVREAIEQRRWDDARAYVVRTAMVIEDYANRLDAAPRWGGRRHDRHSTGRMIELAAAVLLLGAGIYFYRRRDPTADKNDNYGAQGAVILFVVAVIMALHALGGLDYHPSEAECRDDQGARAIDRLLVLGCLALTACAATPAARAPSRRRARLPARPVARLHLPGRLGRVAVRPQRRDLRRAQQRRLVRFRLFPRHRRVRRRRRGGERVVYRTAASSTPPRADRLMLIAPIDPHRPCPMAATRFR